MGQCKVTISQSELKLELIKNNESGVTWWWQLPTLELLSCGVMVQENSPFLGISSFFGGLEREEGQFQLC